MEELSLIIRGKLICVGDRRRQDLGQIFDIFLKLDEKLLALLGQKIDGHHAQLQQLQGPLLERELTSLGDDAYRITLAVAGFAMGDLSLLKLESIPEH